MKVASSPQAALPQVCGIGRRTGRVKIARHSDHVVAAAFVTVVLVFRGVQGMGVLLPFSHARQVPDACTGGKVLRFAK